MTWTSADRNEAAVTIADLRGRWAWAGASVAVGTLALVLLLRQPASAMVETWRQSPSFEHGALILLVVAALIWFRRRRLTAITPHPCWWGLLPAAVASSAAAVGAAATALVVEQLALVALIQALALTVLGWRAWREILFPLAYFYFAVPLGDFIVPFLRDATAVSIVTLLHLADIPAVLDGFLIRLPSADYRVAEACAGLRFFLVSLAVSVLAAHLLLRSWWRHVLFLSLAAAIPVAGNALRAAILIGLAHKGVLDPGSIFLHLTYGLGFTALLLVLLLLVAFAMRDTGLVDVLGARQLGGNAADPGFRLRTAAYPAAAAAVVALAAAAGLPQAIASIGEPTATAAIAFPTLEVSPPWRPAMADRDWRPGIAGADAEVFRTYVEDGYRVDLLIALFARQREGAEAVSASHWHGILAGWREVSRVPAAVAIDEKPMRFDAIIAEANGRRRLVLVCYWVRGRFTASAPIAKVWQVQARLLGATPAAAVIVASVPFVEDPGAGGETFRRFLRHLEPLGPALSAAISSSR